MPTPSTAATLSERLLRWAGWVAAAVVAAAALIWNWRLERVSDVLSATAILTGFLFGTLVFVFQLRLRITDDAHIPSYGRLRDFIDLAWRHFAAAAFGLATTAIAVFADLTTPTPATGEMSVGYWWTAALALFGIKLLALMPMALWDLRKAYNDVPG